VSRRSPRLAVASLLAAALLSGAAACSDDGGSDPETTGPVEQAVEQLRDFGLTADEAECVVDELGADTVVESTDLSALTGSQQYQDAADTCIDG
jgi:hypothetical protein